MGILLGFMPFVAFAVLSGLLGPTGALAAGAAVSAALILRGRRNGATFKILEVGTLVLFVVVAIYTATAGSALSLIAVRLCVDCGLLAIVLVSMAMRRPFTLQYAKQQVPREYWRHPAFLRTNYVITGAWAVVFLVMLAAEAALLRWPFLPQPVGFAVILAALLGGVGFTRWYSALSRRTAAARRV